MTEFENEFVEAARSHLGEPFLHHFIPEDLCDRGARTEDDCMERGLGEDGFDCSGLVVVSACEVLGVNASDWPREFRHARQLESLAEEREPNFGEVGLFYSAKSPYPHMGILVTKRSIIHADGLDPRMVVEREVAGGVTAVKAISTSSLLEAGSK